MEYEFENELDEECKLAIKKIQIQKWRSFQEQQTQKNNGTNDATALIQGARQRLTRRQVHCDKHGAWEPPGNQCDTHKKQTAEKRGELDHLHRGVQYSVGGTEPLLFSITAVTRLHVLNAAFACQQSWVLC